MINSGKISQVGQGSREDFGNHLWQLKNSITKVDQVERILGKLATKELMVDIRHGQHITPMNIRITPYVFSLINWEDPIDDPIRKQFLPLGSQFLPDHPYYRDDSLSEDVDSPVPMLTHRYSDKVLFPPNCTMPCLL